MGEFELIERFFGAKAARVPGQPERIALGIGDDCALLQPAPGQQLAISTDMMLEGRHFLPDVDPAALGHKALAINLSDLAAMGAEPLAFTLALALPPERAADAAWLDAFSDGMLALAEAHQCALIGGDTTAGPLALSVTVFGQVPAGQALRRDGARAGDDLWVSGTLGAARLALGARRAEWTLAPDVLAAAEARMDRPTPRVALGQALRGLAHSAIDISDGLLGDVGHILKASRVGATIDAALVATLLPCAPTAIAADDLPGTEIGLRVVLSGGDDYELAFSAPAAARPAVEAAARRAGTRVTRIGQLRREPGLQLLGAQGRPLDTSTFRSFDHFA
ncbi:MAG TPA: thiamine-phosphate kinase [Ottowia sp.]|uniref:thiamine-phosphate kinase n=1 Tax=Ottowia sp. TaxID=1898956 RepID=UPI002C4CECF0|nr:thiamine-phosphate kinase [Ottowia sp.]HMN21988.1 thiamine-phosphate kinase [Ottowia sp.]